MRGCDNSKIHISSNFILFICLLIMFITLQHFATLNHTTPNYTSLHLSTLHFLSFTLHYSPIWLNPSTIPIVLFHLTSLNQTQYGTNILKLISKLMNPFHCPEELLSIQDNLKHKNSLYVFKIIFCELPGDDSLGIETCSKADCQLLN